MISDPLLYLVIERIKQLKSPSVPLEEFDSELSLLDNILFQRYITEDMNYEPIDYKNRLIESYFALDKIDYQTMGIDSNVWFLELANDIIKDYSNLIKPDNIDRLAYLYVLLEHPYCRYLIFMIYSELTDIDSRFLISDFIDAILAYFENMLPHQERDNRYQQALFVEDRDIFDNEMQTILEDIGISDHLYIR